MDDGEGVMRTFFRCQNGIPFGGAMKEPTTYILASRYHGVLYIGVTAYLLHRVQQHKDMIIEGFTKRYHVTKLVYFEQFHTMAEAIRREKQLKLFRRNDKIWLIEGRNPQWEDLFPSLIGIDG